ncbi:Phenylacetic acid degradation B [Halogranum amylolyticum]|uniref:Phenylacetic acid degradation B n=1 Tax=Halogranum amylolyticum TaxID=660520 RepID=A0A1H8UAS3_9EURY|nr:phenylacetic acid degradation PaaB family protein [Halogranum amylolyticum]SEP00301.1 Phenylacetic acid degradation B [Halogranum amylolyticum]
MKYEVFARLNAGDETIHVGRVEADSDTLAKSYARTTFDEESWDYMIVVRREHIVEVTGEHAVPSPEVDV